jgi:hypothetical protein
MSPLNIYAIWRCKRNPIWTSQLKKYYVLQPEYSVCQHASPPLFLILSYSVIRVFGSCYNTAGYKVKMKIKIILCLFCAWVPSPCGYEQCFPRFAGVCYLQLQDQSEWVGEILVISTLIMEAADSTETSATLPTFAWWTEQSGLAVTL